MTTTDINAVLAQVRKAIDRGATMVEHQRIWLQPSCCAGDEGRLWCEDPDPEDCPHDCAWTEYVVAAAVEEMRQRAEKAERELAIIKTMAATGTAQSFLSTDDETKRFVFALATEESRRRKIAETALLPFARAAEQVDKRIADHARLGMGAMSGEASIGLGIKFKHILAARAALDGPATEGEGK